MNVSKDILKPNTLSHILPELSMEEQQLISGGGDPVITADVVTYAATSQIQ
ncbi:hypothetical protein [Cylindrospermopsis raciborskii]|uniref:hypothetical protein n=1 Tax=Cylindrospermopsis raciborskii TaxID=77022 RepID=UPI001365C69B|nr:hypothetical protein [Cylindrospermopsis raciborskii]